MEKTIYDLKLHEVCYANNDVRIMITRVPGGWVYVYDGKTSTFVPFSKEFKPQGKAKVYDI